MSNFGWILTRQAIKEIFKIFQRNLLPSVFHVEYYILYSPVRNKHGRMAKLSRPYVCGHVHHKLECISLLSNTMKNQFHFNKVTAIRGHVQSWKNGWNTLRSLLQLYLYLQQKQKMIHEVLAFIRILPRPICQCWGSGTGF